jgi:ACR3 family arsenite efflux pump ArsB
MNDDTTLSLLDKLQPFVLIGSVLMGLFLGRLFPACASYTDAVLYVTIIVLVYSVMLGVPHRQIWASYRNRRFFVIAWVVNFVIIPLAAWVLALIFLSEYPPIFVGFILYLVTPCTDWFLVFTDMAGGDVPLALALLPTNLILQVALIPIYLILFTGRLVPFQFQAFFETLIIFIVLPFIAAVFTRAVLGRIRNPAWADEIIDTILSPFQLTVLALVLLVMFAGQTRTITDHMGPLIIALVPVILFFFISFSLTRVVGRWFRFSYGEYALLTCTAAARNSPLSLAIAYGLFPDQVLIHVAVIIGVLIELPVLIFIVLMLRRSEMRYS